MNKFFDNVTGEDFDTHGVSSFYGTCAFDVVGCDTGIRYTVPISEQYGEHLGFEHVWD